MASEELAAKTGLHERWIREWLRGQAAAGFTRFRACELEHPMNAYYEVRP